MNMKNSIPWDIIILKLRKNLSPEDETLFNEWVENENNIELFEQLEIVWDKVQTKVSDYEPDIDFLWKELNNRIQQPVLHREVKPRNPFITRNRLFLQIASVGIVLLISTFFIAYYLGGSGLSKKNQYVAYSTLNSKSKILLPDSSEVWLNSNSSLTYLKDKKHDNREITLQGEAFFKVKHSSDYPFIVKANGVEVKVHGTQFNVNSYGQDDVLVSLYEGSISMKAENNDVMLKPGEQGLYELKNKQIVISEADIEFAKIWTKEEIRFENKNLREVCRYLSKWYGVEFEISPNIKNEQSYTFTFKGQSLEEIVNAMTSIHSFDYKIDRENNKVTIEK